MAIVIYSLAGLSILLAIGDLSTYAQTKHLGLILSSLVSIGFLVLVIVLVHWWSLIVGFGSTGDCGYLALTQVSVGDGA